MSDTITGHLWVAFGPAGAIGSIHRTDDGWRFRLLGEELRPTPYPTLEVARNAFCAALPPGSERPDFREH